MVGGIVGIDIVVVGVMKLRFWGILEDNVGKVVVFDVSSNWRCMS